MKKIKVVKEGYEPLREDVKAANRQATGKQTPSSRMLRKLQAELTSGEQLMAMSPARVQTFAGDFEEGLLAVTTERMLTIRLGRRPRWMYAGDEVASWSVRDIVQVVKADSWMLFGWTTLIIQLAHSSPVTYEVQESDLEWLAGELEHARHLKRR